MKTIIYLLLIALTSSVYSQEKVDLSFVYNDNKSTDIEVSNDVGEQFFLIRKKHNSFEIVEPDGVTFTVKNGKKLFNNSSNFLAARRKNSIKFENNSIKIVEECSADNRKYYYKGKEIVSISYEGAKDESCLINVSYNQEDEISKQVAYIAVASQIKDLNNKKGDYLVSSIILGLATGIGYFVVSSL